MRLKQLPALAGAALLLALSAVPAFADTSSYSLSGSGDCDLFNDAAPCQYTFSGGDFSVELDWDAWSAQYTTDSQGNQDGGFSTTALAGSHATVTTLGGPVTYALSGASIRSTNLTYDPNGGDPTGSDFSATLTSADGSVYVLSGSLAGTGLPYTLTLRSFDVTPGNSGPSGPPSGATPELDSVLLFGAGLAGVAGYAIMRRRARG